MCWEALRFLVARTYIVRPHSLSCEYDKTVINSHSFSDVDTIGLLHIYTEDHTSELFRFRLERIHTIIAAKLKSFSCVLN